MLLARLTWEEELAGAKTIYYVDNEGVREALIKGGTRSLASKDLLLETAAVGARLGGAPWYSRVPSPSNVADGPSRLRGLSAAEWPGAVQVAPRLPSWCPAI